MNIQFRRAAPLRINPGFAVRFLSITVAAHGAFILATTLLDQIAIHHGPKLSDFTIDLPLLIGLSLIYIASLLLRRKRTAWMVAAMAYTFYLGIGVAQSIMPGAVHHFEVLSIVRLVLLPVAVLGLLIIFEKQFIVKSDVEGFRGAVRFAVIIVLAALIYGTSGFLLLDKSDFHQEIGVATAAHYTIDQFDLTTNKPLTPYTRRASLFSDSLSFVSVASLVYIAFSLFQPLRARLTNQESNRALMTSLLGEYNAPSEDYFKLWPHDKQYYFDDRHRSGLAFHVSRGVALIIADPAGDPKCFNGLLTGFENLCFRNDWLTAFIHIEDRYRKMYEQHGYSLQQIGQEAVLDLAAFDDKLVHGKYFRQIRNKFDKRGFSCQLQAPPHSDALIDRLKTVSDDWLGRAGRTERGYVMGYFTPEYIQQCPVMVMRDEAGTIQAFMNQVPADFDTTEATYDMLRHTDGSLGNTNDYLMLNFIDSLRRSGYQRLNMGLSPLVGLGIKSETEDRTLIDTVLRFAYLNGDRFYSFSGLHRFKSKYKPVWHDRFIAHQGGVRGFSRTTTALMRAMKVRT